MIRDDWKPPPCKHGSPPIVQQEFIDWDYGTYMGTMPTYKSLNYDCPDPMGCVREQRQIAEKDSDGVAG